MSYRIQYFGNYAQLTEKYRTLLDIADQQGLYSQGKWFDFLMRHYYYHGNVMRLYTIERASDGKPLLMLPMCYGRVDKAVRGAHSFAALSHPENFSEVCVLIDPEEEHRRKELLVALFSWLANPSGSHMPEHAEVLRIQPFPAHSELGKDFHDALKESGYAVQIYANSYNQYESVAGMSFEDYLASRSSNQRYNSRRRRRKLEKQGELEFVLVTDASDEVALRDVIDEYTLVSVNSWKSRESTISKFLLEWMQIAAELGCARLGVLKLDGKAIAAQFWVYSGGVANLIRTNFREDFRDLAPGVVLSNMIIEHLLDKDHAESLDLGYGDEDYKGRWVRETRGYVGIMAFNPGTLRGYYFGHKHILGQPIRRMVKRGRVALQSRGSV